MSASPSVRPYERANDHFYGLITPGDVHAWVVNTHTEEEWQARERVLLDQRSDAEQGVKIDTRLLLIGFWTAIYMAVLAVLSLSLVHWVGDDGRNEPVWAIALGIVSTMAALAGFVAVWMSTSDYRGMRVKQRIAERALREHHIGYSARG